MSNPTAPASKSGTKRCSWAMDRPGSKGDFQCGLIIPFSSNVGVPLCPTHWTAFVSSALVSHRGEAQGESRDIEAGFVTQRDEAQRENRDLTYRISRLQGERARATAASDAAIKALRAENNRLLERTNILRAGLASSSKVYLITCGDQVKIGRSGDPKKRLAQIQGGNACLMESTLNPAEARLIYEMPGHATEETELHRRFRAYRTTGEWFRIEGELADYIRGLGVMVS